jgi:hypothetical protein
MNNKTLEVFYAVWTMYFQISAGYFGLPEDDAPAALKHVRAFY